MRNGIGNNSEYRIHLNSDKIQHNARTSTFTDPSSEKSRPPEVYFIKSPITAEKVAYLLEKLPLPFISEKRLIGIKLHWGEEKNTTHISPGFVRPIIDFIKKRGASPFLTDSLTLYSGKRRDGVSSIILAHEHGFYFADAPVIIADGLRGENKFVHKIKAKHFDEVELCGVLNEADGFVIVSHFKGHIESGFGGAMKNISMGFASRRMKQLMHADVTPILKEEKCTGCGRCVKICPSGAIELVSGLPRFDYEHCIGCASCIAVCPVDALKFHWAHDPMEFLERLVEGAYAAFEFLRNKSIFLNFLVNITPECDCMPYEQEIIVEDVGLLASFDPVAIDFFSLQLLDNAPTKKGSSKEMLISNASSKLKALYPDIPFEHQFRYAESIGLGSTSFTLINL